MRTPRAIPVVRHGASACHTDALAAWPNRPKALAVRRVKTLDGVPGHRLAVSLEFYSALGYQEVGRISRGDGATLTVLEFRGEEVVALELVHRPADGPVQIGTGFSHLVVQVDDLAGAIAALSQRGRQPEPERHSLVRTGPQTSGSPTLMATRSSLCSGRPGTSMG
jgi:lactoylglutathione lyase